MQYGFHFLVRRRYSSLSLSCGSVIDPCFSTCSILCLSRFIIPHIASGPTALPSYRLQISRASGSSLSGCKFSQSRTNGNEHVSRVGPPPVFVLYGISPSAQRCLSRTFFI